MRAAGPTGVEIACDLAESAAQMVEARFRREHPSASDEEVARCVQRWWSDRPGAPHGDAVGRVRPIVTS
ncbi:MAG: hypothetical protein ABL953_02765 [Ilumatobacteraceae bacterium]